ncbi:DUF3147 family protein, partial [Pseudoxanthomonas winnipegensis]|uniref:DUF3147 family protein n=1 Tax=Pseudoxanthomonas winnipegensis TaxID=2480810 RepID=UPI0030F38BB5
MSSNLPPACSTVIPTYAVTARIGVVGSEAAKRSDRRGGLLAALPLVTLLALVGLQRAGMPADMIATNAWYTFWYVGPTLPMFLAFPLLLPR